MIPARNDRARWRRHQEGQRSRRILSAIGVGAVDAVALVLLTALETVAAGKDRSAVWPSQAELGRRIGRHPATVRKLTRQLELAGVVLVRRWKPYRDAAGRFTRRNNLYRLINPAASPQVAPSAKRSRSLPRSRTTTDARASSVVVVTAIDPPSRLLLELEDDVGPPAPIPAHVRALFAEFHERHR